MVSLYFHIPFCERKCLYCDFYSVEGRTDIPTFVDSLVREIDLRQSFARGSVVDTIYFGGGTPSLLTPEQVHRVLGHLRSVFTLSSAPEVTLEANPGTILRDSLSGFRQAGINRLSIGVQSFDDADLTFLGRIHDSRQALDALHAARSTGFDNVSLDFIYALPGQSLESWQRTLGAAIALAPEHISAYNLIVEEGTPLSRLVTVGSVTPRHSDEEALFFDCTMAALESAGFEHYEVSNYARPGYRSRHNSAYWDHTNYLGFGPSGHSFWRDGASPMARRWWNAGDVRGYVSAVDSGRLPVGGEESLGINQLANERIFLGLRSSGLDIRRLKTDLGFELSKKNTEDLAAALAEGLAVADGDVVRLTRKGYLICDEIAARLMHS
jgi:oxygen-independent coproporphyrinogen III oxidase